MKNNKSDFCGIFWDIQNCSVPKKHSPFRVTKKIQSFYKSYERIEVFVVTDVYKEISSVMNGLNQAGCKIHHISSEYMNSADEVIVSLMETFASDFHRRYNLTMLLITGDGDFENILYDLRNNYPEITLHLLHPVNSNERLFPIVHQRALYLKSLNDYGSPFPSKPVHKSNHFQTKSISINDESNKSNKESIQSVKESNQSTIKESNQSRMESKNPNKSEGKQTKFGCCDCLGSNDQFGFRIIGGKDAERSCRVEKVTMFTPAWDAGLRIHDYLVSVQGQHVFNLTHNQVVNIIRQAGNSLQISVERGDHIVPSFDEIWPGQNPKKSEEEIMKKRYPLAPEHGMNYVLHAMNTGIPGKKDAVFTTVGKPRVHVVQYDNPINCYSKDVIDEMTETSATWKAQFEPPPPPPQTSAHRGVIISGGGSRPGLAPTDKKFDPRNSAVLEHIVKTERRGFAPIGETFSTFNGGKGNNQGRAANPNNDIFPSKLPRYFYSNN